MSFLFLSLLYTTGPSINYVVSKLAIFDPLSPLSSFLLSKVYLINRLLGYPPSPYRDDIVYGRPLSHLWEQFSPTHKVHIFQEGHKIWRNLPLISFDISKCIRLMSKLIHTFLWPSQKTSTLWAWSCLLQEFFKTSIQINQMALKICKNSAATCSSDKSFTRKVYE